MSRSSKIGWALGTLFLLLLVGSIIFAAFGLQRERRDGLALTNARAILDQGDWDAAIALLDKLLESHLSHNKAAAAFYARGRAENAKRRYDSAIRDLTEAIRLNYPAVHARWERGYAYQCKGEFELALDDYHQVLHRDPNIAKVHFNCGLIHLLRKEWSDAAEEFSEVVRCEPEDAEAYLQRGSALAELGDLNGAVASVNVAISLKPKEPTAYAARAKLRRQRGELDRAEDDQLQADRLADSELRHFPIFPTYPESVEGTDLLQRARMALETGRDDEVIELCSQALRTHLWSRRASDAFMTRGNAYAHKQDWDRAFRDYDEAVRIAPNNADALTNRGNAYARRKKLDESTRDYDQAIRLNPNLSEAYYNRALNYLKVPDTNKALADLDEAIRTNPKFAEAYARRSLLLIQSKCENEAISDANMAVALKPESGESYYYRARVQLRRKQFAEARSDYECIVELASGRQPEALNALAWLCATCPDQSVRDGRRAVELAKEACDLTQWNDQHIIDTLAAAYAEAGDFPEAVKWQKRALDSFTISADVRSGMERRLQLYQQHQPYHQELPPEP